ncbi:MAG: cation-translocating P-type ATPase, partial [Planctomycetota bacterium]
MTQSEPWAHTAEDVLAELSVEAAAGLSPLEVRQRRRRFGRNRLRETRETSALAILAVQFKSLIVALLVAATVVSFAFGQALEGSAIMAVILVNAALGFFTELRAVRSMEALRRLGSVTARVRRDGKVSEIAAQRLVPGDILILEAGDLVAADLRIVTASKLQSDESALTGESLPVAKTAEPVSSERILAERSNMLFKGTSLTRGSGEAVVIATGLNTELGRISSLVAEAEEEQTPLEKRLNAMARSLIGITLLITALVGLAGVLRGKELFIMIETSIALAVAAIPEGLPIVATVALARGMWRMVKKNALVNRLSSVETLGATTVICTDKTGTLTENRMTVRQIILDAGRVDVNGAAPGGEGHFTLDGKPLDTESSAPLKAALEAAVLCNNASLGEGSAKPVGDPLEVALLLAAAKAGISREPISAEMPEEREDAFDSDTMMMATFNREGDSYRVSVKGAPEGVLKASSRILGDQGERPFEASSRDAWVEESGRLAREGLRILALAVKTSADLEEEAYRDLTFIGLLAMSDPPRREVRESIEACRRAGIRVVMVTGDQAATARNIAAAVGLVDSPRAEVISGEELEGVDALPEEGKRRLVDASVFSRVSPRQKLHLISLHQEAGAIVAMTGDGVNDAPALKKADIGVAMGRRGTQVAREAADMVLKDDSFPTIVAAVEQGRAIFANIRRFVVYLLSCNISEILTVFFASAVNAPLPILPLQILYLNLITDIFPALALGAGEGDPSSMTRPPRDTSEPVISRRNWIETAAFALVITAAVLGAFAVAIFGLSMKTRQAVTVSFLTLAFAQLWHVFNMRDAGSRILRNDVTLNRWVWAALGLCTVLLVAAVYLPGLSDVLRLEDPGVRGWALV